MHFVEEVLNEFIYSSPKFIEYFYNQFYFSIFKKYCLLGEKEMETERNIIMRETSISYFPYAS